MKTSVLEFPFPARRVYTACKSALEQRGEFRSIKGNENTYRLTASKGLPIFGEDLVINIIATSSGSCEVRIKSSDKLLFNPFKIGNNRRNITNLDQYVRNEVFKTCDSSRIQITQPNITLKQPEIRIK